MEQNDATEPPESSGLGGGEESEELQGTAHGGGAARTELGSAGAGAGTGEVSGGGERANTARKWRGSTRVLGVTRVRERERERKVCVISMRSTCTIYIL